MIDLTVKIDNDEAKKKLEELRRTAKQTTSSIVTDAERMDEAMRFRPQIDKKAAKEAEKTMQAIAETMPLNIGAAFQKTERQIKSFVAKLQKEVQQAQISSWTSEAIGANPLAGIEETLTHLPEKANAAAGGFNNLNFATQQLVREVPAATMGLHMFFLAISNNLPFFADAIKQVREENKALAASGKPTVGVFKQIIGSLFSWQTALIAGITALTLYGKEIGNWVKGLFKGKEALDAIARAEKILADVRRQGMLDAQEEVTQVKLAVKAMQDSNRSLDERKRAMRTLQDQYPEYFGKLKEEQMLYGEVGDSVDALIQKMVALATARKSFDKLVENEEKLALLKDTKGYGEFDIANTAFEKIGRKERRKVLSYGKYVEGVSPEYLAWERTQDAFLENLKEGGKEAEALYEEISEKYDGDVNAYIKAIEESNKKLTDKASAVITTPDLSEDKAAAEEQKHKAEAAAEEQKRKAEAALAEAKREAEERKRAIQRLNNDLSKEVQRTQREMDDAEIATIKDGIERKQREIQAGYERRAAEIDKYEADIKAAQGGELTPEQKGHISYLRQANTDTLMAGKVLIKAMQDEAAQEAVDAMNEYLASYGAFQERLVAITAKYSRLIADAQTEGERKTLEYERDAILAEYEVQASDWAKKLVDKTAEQLTTMADNLQSVLDGLQTDYDALGTSDSEEAKQLLQTINMLKAQIKVLKERVGDASKAVNDDNWAEATQVFQNIGSAATDAVDGIAEFDEGLADALRGIAQLASSATNMIGAIKGVMTAFKEGLSGIEKASAILAVVGAAIQLVSGIVSGLKNANKEYKETIENFKALNKELEQMHRLANINSLEGTIFGEDAFGNFVNNLDVMRDAAKTYSESMDAVAKAEYNRRKSMLEFQIAHYSAMPDYGPSDSSEKGRTETLDELFAALDELKASELAELSAYESLQQMEVRLSRRKRSTLAEQLPELFEGGEITLEGLQKLQQSDVWDKLSKENRDLIEQMIADWEYYNEATQAVTDYLKRIFGDVGASISDAFVDAFENGTNAMEAFGDAMSEFIENLTEQMAYAAFIQPLLEEAQVEMNKLVDLKAKGKISEQEFQRGMFELTNTMMQGVQNAQEGYNSYLEMADKMGEAYGLDLWNGDGQQQSASSGGFQAMSQETGSELNGRFTDIQGQTHRIADAVEFMKGISVTQAQHTASISETLAFIRNDTTLIERHTRVLGDMNDKLGKIIQNTEYL
ncbi:MAG: hypothetical protein J6U93_05175 [Alistipes sp.]|nr:hypothetical protein [Alistipes sp.]